ncbi:MAG: acetoacetate decarboxylase family protein [Nannocystales bacterium]
MELWAAPRSLDLAGSLRGSPSARFIASGPCTIIGVPTEAISERDKVAALAEETQRLWSRVEADARRDDDTFMDWARPIPGPWWFEQAKAAVVVMQGDPARLRASMPRGVRPLPGTGGRYLLAVTRFDGVGSEDRSDRQRFSYHEVTPFLPVWSGIRGPATFIPELYPDAWMAVLLGREILGFPKRTARVALRERGGELIVGGRLALKMRWSEACPTVPNAAVGALGRALVPFELTERVLRAVVPDRPKFSALVHKRIGASNTAGQTLAIDEVVRVPVQLDPIHKAESLQGLQVEVGDGPGILHGKAIAGWRLHTGFRFGVGLKERSIRTPRVNP